MSRHEQRERTPPASCLDHALTGLELKLATDEIELRDLCLLQGRIRRREIRARVDHLVVQPQTIEVVPDVVVMMHVLASGARVVRSLPQPPRTTRTRERAVDGFEQFEEIALDIDEARHVGLTEIELGIPHPPVEGRPLLEYQGRDRRARTRGQFKAVPQHESDGGALDEHLDSRERPAVDGGGSIGRDPSGGRRSRRGETFLSGHVSAPAVAGGEGTLSGLSKLPAVGPLLLPSPAICAQPRPWDFRKSCKKRVVCPFQVTDSANEFPTGGHAQPRHTVPQKHELAPVQ